MQQNAVDEEAERKQRLAEELKRQEAEMKKEKENTNPSFIT